jgi:hypothetical protein
MTTETQLAELVVRLNADTAEYIKAMKGAGKETDETGKKKIPAATEAINQAFKRLAAAGVVAIAGAQLKQFALDSIRAASDVGETMSKFNVVFRDSAGAVMESLKDFGSAAGRSQYELAGFAATLQDTFVPLGFARDEAADLSVELVKLATDLASFNNLDTANVINDLQSAMVGNTETLRKYGVVANDAAIKTYALENGLWDGKAAMDATTKANAILAITLAGTTDAQGDAIRTADGFANRQRALEASVVDLKVALGNMLLPAANWFVDIAQQGIKNLTGLVGVTIALKNALEDQRVAAMDANLTWEEYLETQGWLIGATDLYNFATGQSLRVTYEQEQAVRAAAGTMDGWSHILTEVAETNLPAVTGAVTDVTVSLDDLKSFVDGELGPALEDFEAQQRDLYDRAGELRDQIIKLEQRKYLTSAQRQELDDLQAEYDATIGQIRTQAEEHELATKQIVFDLLVQRAALDELTSAELDLLTQVAEKWGLIDEETRTATLAVDQSLTDLANGKSFDLVIAELERVALAASAPAGDYSIRYLIQTVGDVPVMPGAPTNKDPKFAPQEFATGGAFTVGGTGGTDSQLVQFMATPGERVIVQTPAQQQAQGGGGKAITIYGGLHLHGVQDQRSLLDELQRLEVRR